MRRRIRRDGPLLAVWTLTVAFAIVLAIVGPAHLASTIDAGAQETVAAAGDATDLVIQVPVAEPNNALQLSTVRPGDVLDVAADFEDGLPSALRQTRSATTVSVTGQSLLVRATDVEPALTDRSLQVRMSLAMLTTANADALKVIEGTMPGGGDSYGGPDGEDAGSDARGPIEILVSSAGAAASSLTIGSVIFLPVDDAGAEDGTALLARVVGIVDQQPGGSAGVSPWRDVPELWEPSVISDGGTTFLGATVLLPTTEVDRVVRARQAAFTGVFRYSFDPAAFTSESLVTAAEQSRRLVANSTPILAGGGYSLEVSSGFADAVADFGDRARATLAELSIIVAGVVGSAAAVLVLVSRLLVARRLPELLLERARGSSLAAIGARTLAEAVATVGLALLLALGVTWIIRFDRTGDAAPLIVVVTVALLIGVVQTIAGISTRSSASAVGVNRRDAVRRRRRRRAGRVAAEAAVLLLAALSVVALLDRGLLQTVSEGIDPLLASAPVLFAVAVAIVLFRVSDLLVRAAAVAARAGRGIAGPVISSRLTRGLPVIPLAALTVSVALVVGTALIGQSVRAGQIEASWQVVGADARVDGRVSGDDAAGVTTAEGVTATSALNQRSGKLDLGTNGVTVTMLAVDRDYPQFVAGLPDVEGVTDAAEAGEFALLADEEADQPDDAARDDAAGDDAAGDDAAGDDGPLPVVVDSVIAQRMTADDLTIALGPDDVRLTVVGTVRSGPTGHLDGPLLYVDLAAMSSRLSTPLIPNTFLALGPGAATAVDQLDHAERGVLTRPGWVEDRRGLALIAGVEQAVVAGAVVLALLALIAIVSTALGGSRERARYLALLRTLGVRPRFGVLLAVIDQGPLLIATLVGGLLAGVGIAVLLGPALGLEYLTGGLSRPDPTVPPAFLARLAGGVMAVFAVGTLIEVLLRRRDRVGDTIRVGETL